MDMKLLLKEKKFIILSVVLVLVVVSICVGSIILNKANSQGEKKYVISEMRGSYSIDVNNLSSIVSDADYVFVGKINEILDTEYKWPVDVNGETVSSPYTNYSVSVVENIKNDLDINQPIFVQKAGGISEDKSEYFVYEDDVIPEVGSYYIFSVYVQSDGSLLASGPNSTIVTNKKCDSKSYSEMIKANKTAKANGDTDRKRHKIKKEKLKIKG